MTKPLALVLYQNIFPCAQLVNRLDDMGYRVETLTEAGELVPETRAKKPIIVVADLYAEDGDVCGAIQALKANKDIAHVPILAINPNNNEALRREALSCGANLVVADEVVLHHLPEFLNQALEVR